jgi:hypothetical protein
MNGILDIPNIPKADISSRLRQKIAEEMQKTYKKQGIATTVIHSVAEISNNNVIGSVRPNFRSEED